MTQSDDRFALAQAVLRPVPRPSATTPRLTKVQKLDHTISYLESKHHEQPKKRSHILATSLAVHQQQHHQQLSSHPPTSKHRNSSTAVAAALRTSWNPKTPPPIHTPSFPPPPPPLPSSSPKTSNVINVARNTVKILEMYEEQAQKTLRHYYNEREKEKTGGFGEFGAAATTAMGTEKIPRRGSEVDRNRDPRLEKRSKGDVDRSRDPRLRREGG
ncbi:MAG: hypothetical protein Q9167_006715 [Letrouitia subvulpina]